MSPRLLAVLFSGVALVSATLPALAIEPEEAADALLAALTDGNSTKADYDEVTLDAGTIVITGLTLSRGGAPAAAAPAAETPPAAAGSTIAFEEARIESPTDSETGVFDSPSIIFTGGAISGEASGSIEVATLTDVTVLDPDEVEGNEPGQALNFHTAEATGLSFTPEGDKGVLTIGRMFMETGDLVDDAPQSNKGSVEAISIPVEAFADAQVGPQTIGYDALVLGMTWDGTRDRAADTMTLRDFTLSVQDGGDLSISGIMGKLPEPSAMNDADASSKASQMEVHALTLRYDDKSLAGRILDYMAKQQGVSRADYANQIAAALPFLLAALNNPEFQNEVAGALGAFLKDPKSLTIKLEPSAPVSGTEIMSIAGSAPQTLPDRLNASVTANTAE